MVRLNRLGLNDGKNYGGGQTVNYILKVVDKMIEHGNKTYEAEKDKISNQVFLFSKNRKELSLYEA